MNVKNIYKRREILPEEAIDNRIENSCIYIYWLNISGHVAAWELRNSFTKACGKWDIRNRVYNVFVCFIKVEVEIFKQTKFWQKRRNYNDWKGESELDSVFLLKVNSWGSWGICNEKCAVGSKQRTRTVKISKRCQGKACPTLQVSINYSVETSRGKR